MITGRIGHEVLLLINHNYNKIGDILGFFKIKTGEILSFFCWQWKNAILVRMCHGAYCPIS